MPNNKTLSKILPLNIAVLIVLFTSTNIASAGWFNPVQLAELHRKFVNDLPVPKRIDARAPGTSLKMEMRQSKQWLGLHDIWGHKVYTKVWGYNQVGHVAQHMGPTIIAQRDAPVHIEWKNKLPDKHLFTVPMHGHMAMPEDGRVPSVVHLHGAHVEAKSDGYPTVWYTRDYNAVGEDFDANYKVYNYDNSQEAATLWYHDHVLGITRLNVNAGLAGMYLIRDDNETSLDLPSGDYERELMIQDIQIDSDGNLVRQLEFPAFFGNYVLVNGMTWPKMEVEPRKYRFRILNASDSRFYKFHLTNGLPFIQIGTEGGFINAPQTLESFTISPGERYDMVIDFSQHAGESIYLENTMGILPGLSNVLPSLGRLVKFNVAHSVSTPDKPLPAQLRDPLQSLGEPDVVRKLLLGQALDLSNDGTINPMAPLIDLLGTVDGGLMRWVDDVTEFPEVGDVEVWEIYNTLLVPHPIHVHQVEFEIIDRQPVFPLGYTPFYFGNPTGPVFPILHGNPSPPLPFERGPKDEVIVPPLTMARIRMRFDRPGKYVWHCHILTHEDHDMMRPMEVIE